MAREVISQAISQSHFTVPPAKYQCSHQVGLVVSLHSVLRQVQTFHFIFLRDSELSDDFQEHEEDKHGDEGVSRDHNRSNHLGYDVVITEDTSGDTTPDTTQSVDREGTDGIVDFEFFECQVVFIIWSIWL